MKRTRRRSSRSISRGSSYSRRTVTPMRRRVYRTIHRSDAPSYRIRSSLPHLKPIRPALVVRRGETPKVVSKPQIPSVFLLKPGRSRPGAMPRFAKQLKCLKRRRFKKDMMKKIAAQVKAGGGSIEKWRLNRRRNQEIQC